MPLYTNWMKAVSVMWSLEMARSKRKANPAVLVMFHLRATLAAEHRDSSTLPFKKTPRAPSRRSRRKRWKIIQVKWFSLMWLWQSLVLSLNLYLDWKSCSKARVVKPQQAACGSFLWQGLDREGSDLPEHWDMCLGVRETHFQVKVYFSHSLRPRYMLGTHYLVVLIN